jgi:hypothetical protein
MIDYLPDVGMHPIKRPVPDMAESLIKSLRCIFVFIQSEFNGGRTGEPGRLKLAIYTGEWNLIYMTMLG